MMYIQLIGINRLLNSKISRIVEELTGEELYRKYPIGDYYQQGDVLVKSKPTKEIKYEELSDQMKERIRKLKYQLIEMEMLKNRKVNYLYMNNASIFTVNHLEGVKGNNIFEAIKFRNKEEYLPFEIS